MVFSSLASRVARREDAANAAHVSLRTVYRRLDDEKFCQRVDRGREELISHTTARLAAASSAAADTLVELMAPAFPPSVRLAAARSVLEQAQRWRLCEEVESRVTALEALMSRAS